MSEDQILDIGSFKEDNHSMEVELVSTAKFLILSIATTGLYDLWWMYKMWRFFKVKDKLDIMPAMRVIFAIFFLYGLFEIIKKFAHQNNVTASYPSGWLFVGVILLNSIANIPYYISYISFIGGLLYFSPIRAFNQAARNDSDIHAIERNQFNKRQIGLLIIGSLFWFLILFATFFPDEASILYFRIINLFS